VRNRGVSSVANLRSDVIATAAEIRSVLGFDLEERQWIPTWTDALRRFIEQADALGVLLWSMESSAATTGGGSIRRVFAVSRWRMIWRHLCL